tara:strand:+ start:138 stop:1265 length:1128 start_codon:yes stop_codon:yes gene_type:complete
MIIQVQPLIGNKEYEYVKDALDRSWLSEGKYTQMLCEKIQQITNAKYVLPVPNCTLGLFLCLKSLDMPANSEVIVTDFTFFASASTIVSAGLRPVFVDVCKDTFQIDINKIEEKITKNTKAIMPVHVYGHGSNINEVMKIAKKHNLKVIEDAAQVLGVSYCTDGSSDENCCGDPSKMKHLGMFGDFGVFSLYADKTVTMGEGGIIITNSKSSYEKLQLLRNQGRLNSGTFIHDAIGMNFRITDLQAAVGCAQVDTLSDIKLQRNETYKKYLRSLSSIDEISFMKVSAQSEFIPFRFPIMVNDIDDVMKSLEEKGIQTRRFFYPMSMQPPLKKFSSGFNKISNRLYEKGVCLPIHADISDDDIDLIAKTLKDHYKK